MNKRIAKKLAGLAITRGWTVPCVVSHAKASFYALDAGRQRTLLRRKLVAVFRVASRQARRSTSDWRFAVSERSR